MVRCTRGSRNIEHTSHQKPWDPCSQPVHAVCCRQEGTRAWIHTCWTCSQNSRSVVSSVITWFISSFHPREKPSTTFFPPLQSHLMPLWGWYQIHPIPRAYMSWNVALYSAGLLASPPAARGWACKGPACLHTAPLHSASPNSCSGVMGAARSFSRPLGDSLCQSVY